MEAIVGPIGLDSPMGSREFALVRRVKAASTFEPTAVQSQVLAHCAGATHSPLIVYGAPGTGKSATLVESVVSRINAGMNPNSILIVAYGRERASEIRDQIALRTTLSAFEPIARTFHSLAFSIINEKSDLDSPSYVLVSGAEQDLFIRSLLEYPEDSPGVAWPKDLELALHTRGFARELRDLILRASERNMSYQELIELSQSMREKYWEPAAKFWEVYDNVMALRYASVPGTPLRIDPSAIISQAINQLRSDATLALLYRNRFSAIYIDEFHESDIAQRQLLSLIAGKDLTLFADPDSAIGRFRGADPEGIAGYADSIGASSILLEHNFRSEPAIDQLSADIASRFRVRSPARKKVELAAPEGLTSAIDAVKLASASDCANYIAHTFRTAHLRDGVPWSEMAVILRSPASGVAALSRAFALNGIPLDVDAQALALAENPAIRPFLTVAQISLGSIALTPKNWEIIEELLRSEIGGADALTLRQIRVEVSKEREADDLRTSTESIIDYIKDPIAPLDSPLFAPLARIGDLIRAGEKALRMSKNVSDLLWAIWSSAKSFDGENLANAWRDRALRGGVRGAAADRDLDAMMTLFESARRFTDRMPYADPSQFINQILGETILGDAITARALREEVVSILTVHSAKGREWSHVALMGLQEGTWPNLRQRGSLLGSERLVEALRSGLTSREEIEASAASALVEDERRLLYVALSRAKSKVIATAYRQEDSEPSPYFEEIFEFVHGHSSEEAAILELPRALTTQALVAQLRRTTMGIGAPTPEKIEVAAKLLASLSAAGIESANPNTWLGVTPISSTDPAQPATATILVSPSNLESFSECGLKWFIERSGGRDGDSSAQLIGTALHALASLLHKEPSLTFDQLQERLADNWKLINNNTGWVREYEFGEATRKLSKFFAWHEKNYSNGRTLVGVEERFEIPIGRAKLIGSADRIEIDVNGLVYIVDLKSGGSDTSVTEAQDHKQLQGYQLAVTEGGFKNLLVDNKPLSQDSGGAELVFLGGDAVKATIREQAVIDPDAVRADISASAEAMAATTFTATINSRCRTCAVKALCPLQSEGRTVIEP